VSSDTPGRFSAGDLALLELVGERAALAIGHVQLRERERAVAETLQRSLLPERLPELPGAVVVSRYLSRARGVHVGGDFYDAVALDDGRLALVIGDVAGKGLDAATTMGRLRTTLRVYAVEGTAPTEALERLDRIVSEEDGMATALFLVLDPASGRLVFSNAGHPPPLRLGAGGGGEWLTGALAPPLGTAWEGRELAEAVLAPGDRLLLYTDGLVERRDVTLDDGLQRLLDAAGSTSAAAGLDGLVDGVLGALVDGDAGFDDDVAVLAVERSAGR
jgi:phosphoserine phosphatase RsbU/P